MTVDVDRLEKACREVLIAIGEDFTREGLVDTPKRWAKWWKEFIDYDPGKIATTFTSISLDQMVIVDQIRVWSLCEHHLLPFWADVSIGYVASNKILGSSKIARIAHYRAHSLQIQERLTEQIGRDVMALAETKNVAVVVSGGHLCMSMRGIKTPALMKTSYMQGFFRDRPEARAEFLSMITIK